MIISSNNSKVWAAVWLSCAAAAACSSGGAPPAQPVPTAGSAPVAASGGMGPAPSGTGGPGGRVTAGVTGGAGRGPSGGVGGAVVVAGTGATQAGAGGAPTTTAAGSDAPTPSGGGAASVLEYHKNAKRDGHYIDAAFTRAAAAGLKQDASFTAMVAGPTYAQPLYFEGGPGGADLLITATEQNEVTAFNAADGAVVWRKMLDAPASSGLPCGRINPLGVTGTPVIDPVSRTLYVAAMTTGPKHQIYAMSLDDGAMRQGWPVVVEGVKAGSRTFESSVHNQRGALLLLGDTLYVPYGGHYGDCGDYHGWVVGVPTANPSAPIAFATTAKASGIWAPGGLASDGTSVFAATGNSMADGGGFGSSPSTWGHGNAILRLSKQLTNIAENQTADFFAAQDWAAKDLSDLDVGGSGPLLFSAPGSTPSELVIGLGKSGEAFLADQASLGGMGGEIETKEVAGGGIGGGMIQAAAAYTTPTGTFVAFRAVMRATGCGSGSGYLGGIKIAGSPPSMTVAWCAGPNGNGSPIVTSTDGMKDSIVWYVAGNSLLGFNGEDGMPVFEGGGASLGMVASFQTPIVAKGRIFVAAMNQVHAFTVGQ